MSAKADFDVVSFSQEVITLRDRIIEDAIYSIKNNEQRSHRLQGCLEGIECCRSLESIADYEAVLKLRHLQEEDMRSTNKLENQVYWRFRCATVQIEFVYERMKAACNSYGSTGAISGQAIAHVAQLRKLGI